MCNGGKSKPASRFSLIAIYHHCFYVKFPNSPYGRKFHLPKTKCLFSPLCFPGIFDTEFPPIFNASLYGFFSPESGPATATPGPPAGSSTPWRRTRRGTSPWTSTPGRSRWTGSWTGSRRQRRPHPGCSSSGWVEIILIR